MINSIKKTWLDKLKLPVFVSAFFTLSLLGGIPAGLISKSVSATGLSGSERPSVIYTSPENRSGGVFLNSKVSATFNEAMDRSTFNHFSAYMKGPYGTAVSGTIGFNAAGVSIS
ncbi:MAG: Ig-like domain-containing protein [Deltaproteobacteria bacterium]|nr:Ig-like domain-containing protein [Deltaproteobacteria bacterium]